MFYLFNVYAIVVILKTFPADLDRTITIINPFSLKDEHYRQQFNVIVVILKTFPADLDRTVTIINSFSLKDEHYRQQFKVIVIIVEIDHNIIFISSIIKDYKNTM